MDLLRPAIYNRSFKLDGGYELTMWNTFGIRFRYWWYRSSHDNECYCTDYTVWIDFESLALGNFARCVSLKLSYLWFRLASRHKTFLRLVLFCICPRRNRDWRWRMLKNSTCVKSGTIPIWLYIEKPWAHYPVPRVSGANRRAHERAKFGSK